MATEVGQLVLKVDTSQVASAERAVERLGDASQKTTKQTDRLTQQAKRSNVTVGDFGRKAGMAGVQFEQLAGQIAMGQNPMRALGVQAADLGFILGFPLLGAVVGISAAIASALIPSTESAADRMDDLRERLFDMTEGFEKLTAAQRVFLRLELQREIVKLNDEIDNLLSGLVTLGDLAVAQDLARQINELGDTLDALNDNVAEGTAEIEKYVAGLQEEFELLGLTEKATHLYKLAVMGATEAQREQAAAILDKIEARRKELEQEKESERQIRALRDETLKQMQARERDISKAEDNAKRMAQLDETELERAARLRDERLARNQEARDADLISEEQYQEAKRGINAAYNSALAEDERRTMDEMNQIDQERRDYQRQLDEDRRAAAAEITNALLEFEDVLLKGKSEKEKAAYRLAVNLADAEKRQNAADIISKSYVAAMKAYASLAGIPIIGPALGAAAAAAAITVGTSYAAKSLTGRALGGQVRAGESYIVGERGPEVLTMGTGGRITPNEALRNESNTTSNKTTNVSFNIEAADASGFDRLLNSRRGLIIQMINEAVEDQGREAFV
jgi:hypothetical protein